MGRNEFGALIASTNLSISSDIWRNIFKTRKKSGKATGYGACRDCIFAQINVLNKVIQIKITPEIQNQYN
jgi:hypothetical protein